jgi:hypothetical protein
VTIAWASPNVAGLATSPGGLPSSASCSFSRISTIALRLPFIFLHPRLFAQPPTLRARCCFFPVCSRSGIHRPGCVLHLPRPGENQNVVWNVADPLSLWKGISLRALGRRTLRTGAVGVSQLGQAGRGLHQASPTLSSWDPPKQPRKGLPALTSLFWPAPATTS